MKRIILVTLFSIFFGFTSAFAYDACDPANVQLPCSFDNDGDIRVYNAFAYHSGVNMRTFFVSPGFYYQNGTYENSNQIFIDGNVPWINYIGFTLVATNGNNAYYSQPFTIVEMPSVLLSITRSPQLGGGVVVTPPLEFPIFYCGTNGKEECDLEVNQNGQVTLRAQYNPGYAFSHWVINNQTMGDTDGEIDVWMNEDKNVVAVFARTFQDTAGNFDVTIGDECVIYVRNETGIIYDACHGEAADCFEQAQAAGYATGSEPRESAIIVFDRVPGTALAVGHVGIVTSYNGDYVSMHDSNWVGHHTIGNHTELVGENGYNIKGYIYFTPHQ